MKITNAISVALLSFTSSLSAYPTTGQTLYPDNISIYHGYNGAIEYAVSHGKISRVQSGNDDISTLITFTFPESTRGRKCEFNFELDSPPYTATGSPFIDAFFSSQYATASSPGWGPPSNYRDNQLGRLRVVKGGQATVEWGTFVFDCPAGQTKGFEVTPTGDSILVEWNEPADGPWIRWY